MKNKLQDLLMLIMSICVLICAIVIVLNGCGVEQPIEQTEQSEPEQLVIETLPESTSGTLTILDGDGGVYFQYEGEIDIINNGKNGQPIEIIIDLPDTGVVVLMKTEICWIERVRKRTIGIVKGTLTLQRITA